MPFTTKHLFIFVILSLFFLTTCDDKSSEPQNELPVNPECTKTASTRTDAHTPQSMSSDWSQPIRLNETINSQCPEDAIEISANGDYLYFLFTEDVLDSLSPEQILSKKNNTYRSLRIGNPGEFQQAEYYDLTGNASGGSMDGELSFSSDGSTLYFHSNRAENTGYNSVPFVSDYLDIYIADIVNGKPQNIRNIGPPVNSEWPDGEHAIHPDDTSLYFTSKRPGGLGGSDIWVSTTNGTSWSTPVNLDAVNTIFNELQPAFTADGDTMYFASERNPLIGAAIYRSVRTGVTWGIPELMIQGIVGEPSLTADGQLLYFVHVLTDGNGTFDADIWYCTRQ